MKNANTLLEKQMMSLAENCFLPLHVFKFIWANILITFLIFESKPRIKNNTAKTHSTQT